MIKLKESTILKCPECEAYVGHNPLCSLIDFETAKKLLADYYAVFSTQKTANLKQQTWWNDRQQKAKKERELWQGKFNIVKQENNVLRRKLNTLSESTKEQKQLKDGLLISELLKDKSIEVLPRDLSKVIINASEIKTFDGKRLVEKYRLSGSNGMNTLLAVKEELWRYCEKIDGLFLHLDKTLEIVLEKDSFGRYRYPQEVPFIYCQIISDNRLPKNIGIMGQFKNNLIERHGKYFLDDPKKVAIIQF